MAETLADRLAAYACSLRYDDLPQNVVHEAKRRLIDAVGCAFGALDSDAPQIASRLAERFATAAGSRTFYGSCTTPENAAFVNGILMRYLDFNDTYLSKEPAHPSDNLAAVLAAGEVAHSSGKAAILAATVAYEIQCRLADAWSIRAEGWDHVCYGSFSTAVAAGMLLGLTPEAIVHAQGISATGHMAMRQTRAGALSMWKGAAFANAARNGVLAALLAGEGMTGPAPVFEGEMGFFAQVAHGRFDLPALGGRDGAEFMLPRTYIKFWPAEYHAQSAIDAALQLRGEIGDPAEIDRVRIDTFNAAVEIIADASKWHPETRETADHSLPYCVAIALLDGEVGHRQFDQARFTDPGVRDLLSRTEARADPGLNERYPESIPNRITVTTKTGGELARQVEYPRGHVGNPMTDSEVEAKFRALAAGRLPEAACDELLRTLWALEDVTDIAQVMGLLTGSVVNPTHDA